MLADHYDILGTLWYTVALLYALSSQIILLILLASSDLHYALKNTYLSAPMDILLLWYFTTINYQAKLRKLIIREYMFSHLWRQLDLTCEWMQVDGPPYCRIWE